jgi:hypothetical protein
MFFIGSTFIYVIINFFIHTMRPINIPFGLDLDL